jgi:hypothetical protein
MFRAIFSLIIRSIQTVLQLLVLYMYVADCWYHGSVRNRYQLAATYVCNTRICNTVYMLLMMSENIVRNV